MDSKNALLTAFAVLAATGVLLTAGQTPAAGLHYNLRVGTTPGGNEIASATSISAALRRP